MSTQSVKLSEHTPAQNLEQTPAQNLGGSSSQTSTMVLSPYGVGAVPTTLASASSSSQDVGQQHSISPPPSPNPKRAKMDLERSACAQTQTVSQPAIPAITPDQQQAVCSIYQILAEGKIEAVTRLPRVTQRTNFWNYAKEWTHISLQWTTFDWAQMARDISKIQANKSISQEIHPLRFLLLVKENAALREHLQTVRGYTEAWDQAFGSMNKGIQTMVNKWLGDEWKVAPWGKTTQEFSTQMLKHQTAGTLSLGVFLENFPQEQQTKLQEYVDRRAFADLFTCVLG
jgi:hypothetical protein